MDICYWKKSGTKILYNSRWLTRRQDTCLLPILYFGPIRESASQLCLISLAQLAETHLVCLLDALIRSDLTFDNPDHVHSITVAQYDMS